MKFYGSALLVAAAGIGITLPFEIGILQLIFNPSFVDELQSMGLLVFGAGLVLGILQGMMYGVLWSVTIGLAHVQLQKHTSLTTVTLAAISATVTALATGILFRVVFWSATLIDADLYWGFAIFFGAVLGAIGSICMTGTVKEIENLQLRR